MLQKSVEGDNGEMLWKDMTCDDADDFAALWKAPWCGRDSAKGDMVLWLPPARPTNWTPVDLSMCYEAGDKDGNKVGLGIHADTQTSEYEDGRDSSTGCKVGVIGRNTKFQQSLDTNVTVDAESEEVERRGLPREAIRVK